MKLIKNSANSNGAGWTHRFTFYSPTEQNNNVQRYSVGDAHKPHRYRIFNHGNPNKAPIAGWAYEFEFWAYPTKQPGTIPYAVGDAPNPHRFMLFENSENAGRSGWTHQFVFWAYPTSSK